ncbi:hypothetical protein PO909_016718, partial [Leuciscus waleckii]
LGKAWLILVVFLRIPVLLERFVCNTIQPGCANVCYDMFAPLSLFRFWLVQLTTLCLPYMMFVIYVIHKADYQESFGKASLCKTVVKAEKGRVQYFTGAYISHLLLRILVEAGFGAAHYYLFGFHIPRRFMCQQTPCTTIVDCYISRPTEKTILLNFMLGAAALSLLLNTCDFICAIKRSVRQKSKKEGMVREGSEVALYPTETLGSPKTIRVSKHSRLKPPPPPRRDKLPAQGAIDVSGATAVCNRRVGQYTLVEMTTGEDIPTCSGDGQEKRSEWV